jgi:hypothetical protein
VSVAVVVPWRGGCPHRERALEWITARYQAEHPAWHLVVADGPRGTPWVKAEAVMPAALATSVELLVIADADVWCDSIADAVRAVRAGWGWAIPHRQVHRLTEPATTLLLGGADPLTLAVTEPLYRGTPGGGLVVLPRSTLERVPLDPRFAGWGGEDQAWGAALTTLAGPAWRGAQPLIHLWHPPQPRMSRERGSDRSEQLRDRYLAARNRRSAMRALVNEIPATPHVGV